MPGSALVIDAFLRSPQHRPTWPSSERELLEQRAEQAHLERLLERRAASAQRVRRRRRRPLLDIARMVSPARTRLRLPQA